MFYGTRYGENTDSAFPLPNFLIRPTHITEHFVHYMYVYCSSRSGPPPSSTTTFVTPGPVMFTHITLVYLIIICQKRASTLYKVCPRTNIGKTTSSALAVITIGKNYRKISKISVSLFSPKKSNSI